MGVRCCRLKKVPFASSCGSYDALDSPKGFNEIAQGCFASLTLDEIFGVQPALTPGPSPACGRGE